MVVEEMVINSVDWISVIPGLGGLIKIGQVAGVFVIIYVGFLIVRGVMQWKYTRRNKSIEQNVAEINHKLGGTAKRVRKSGKKKSKK